MLQPDGVVLAELMVLSDQVSEYRVVEVTDVAAPDWLRPSACVVAKTGAHDKELDLWRKLAGTGCKGVPRLHVVTCGGRNLALTPDGFKSPTLLDLRQGKWQFDGWLQPGKRCSLERAQSFVAQLAAVMTGIHNRGVVHADLHPGDCACPSKAPPSACFCANGPPI